VVGRVWTFRDVTDREQALAEQRLASEREATIASNLDAALFTFVLNPQRGELAHYEYFSRGAEVLYGIPMQELLDDRTFWFRRVHPDDSQSVVTPAFEGLFRLEPAVIEVRYESSRGLYRWHRSRLIPRTGPDNLIYVDGIETDVNDRVTLEEQLRHAQKLEAIGQLAGGVAHDFNNILTAVLGYSDLLMARVPPSDPNRHALEEIQKGGERAAALTRQLLAFSRRSPAQPRIVDLNSSVESLLPMLRRLAGEDIRFDLDLSPAIGRARVDPSQWEQIVVNLVVNARDAMPRGGLVRISTDRAALGDGDVKGIPDLPPGAYVRLRVADNGCGIPPAAMAHIFEPFFTTKSPGKGTGLGLATVYGIVRQHGGRVTAKSEPERGAEIEILFPEVPPTHAGEATKSARQGTNRAFPSGVETVLLVEDDRSLLLLGREILAELGYSVLTAVDGPTALRILQERGGAIDILVTDVVMPEMGGRELAARVAALKPGVRVLYVSGYTQDSALLQGVQDLEVAFLEKPYTPFTLARAVRDVLDAVPERLSRRAAPLAGSPALPT
jgi:signal transduction histidine kinase/CheY-like chemotaxis protein